MKHLHSSEFQKYSMKQNLRLLTTSELEFQVADMFVIYNECDEKYYYVGKR